MADEDPQDKQPKLNPLAAIPNLEDELAAPGLDFDHVIAKAIFDAAADDVVIYALATAYRNHYCSAADARGQWLRDIELNLPQSLLLLAAPVGVLHGTWTAALAEVEKDTLFGQSSWSGLKAELESRIADCETGKHDLMRLGNWLAQHPQVDPNELHRRFCTAQLAALDAAIESLPERYQQAHDRLLTQWRRKLVKYGGSGLAAAALVAFFLIGRSRTALLINTDPSGATITIMKADGTVVRPAGTVSSGRRCPLRPGQYVVEVELRKWRRDFPMRARWFNTAKLDVAIVGDLAVRVVDEAGKPVPDYVLRAGGEPLTLSDGILHNIRTGAEITVAHRLYKTWGGRADPTHGTTETLLVNLVSIRGELDLSVRDPDGRELDLIAGLVFINGELTTDLTRVAAGSEIRIVFPHMRPFNGRIEPAAYGIERLAVRLERTVEDVRLRVLDYKGQPPERYSLRLAGQTVTLEDGLLKEVRSGERLEVKAQYHHPWRGPLSLTSGQVNAIEIALEPVTVGFLLTVLDDHGDARQDYQLTIDGKPFDWQKVTTRENIPLGALVAVEHPDFRPESFTVLQPGPDGLERVTVNLKWLTGDLRLSVVDPAGAPIKDYQVLIGELPMTAKDGIVHDVPTGGLLRVRHPFYRDAEVGDVIIKFGEVSDANVVMRPREGELQLELPADIAHALYEGDKLLEPTAPGLYEFESYSTHKLTLEARPYRTEVRELTFAPGPPVIWKLTAERLALRVPDDYGTIAAALAEAEDGDVIEVAPLPSGEPYREPLVLDRNIIIRGIGEPGKVMIATRDKPCIESTAAATHVVGLALRRESATPDVNAFAALISAGQTHFEECRVTSVGGSGMGIFGERTITKLSACRFEGSAARGLAIYQRGYTEIIDCDVSGNGETGLLIEGGAQAELRECRVRDNQVSGMFVSGGAKVSVCESLFSGHREYNCAVLKLGELVCGESEFSHSAGYGLAVSEGGRLTLSDCLVSENGRSGVLAGDMSRVKLLPGVVLRGNGSNGAIATGGAVLEMTGCLVEGNQQNGVQGQQKARVSVTHCLIRWNGSLGLFATSKAVAKVRDTVLDDNDGGGSVAQSEAQIIAEDGAN